MQRLLLDNLIEWKHRASRKPLILKGTRQVGKTHLLRQFGEQFYERYHYFNFEKEPDLALLFEQNLDPERIITALSLHREQAIDAEHDLIIFDEIQACPNALTSLKYFCEDLPSAQICAAGSLLGIYLGPVSYPVGKVEHLELFPMSFLEFLMALGDELTVEFLKNMNMKTEISELLHRKLWERLKHYFIVGGAPEVVKIYRDQRNDLLTAFQNVRKKQTDIIEDYLADIAKHSGKINAMHIQRVWRSVPQQLARSQDGSAKKFKFKGVIPGIDRFDKLAGAIDWLESAGLIIKIPIVNTSQIPLSAYTQQNAFKLFLFDIGILGALSQLDPKHILNYDYGSYKGFFAENYVAQAFYAQENKNIYCWQAGTAEIEFLCQIEENIIPVEVKSGFVTQAKSLKVYAQKYQPYYRVIMSAKPMNIDMSAQLQCLPLYLSTIFPLAKVSDD